MQSARKARAAIRNARDAARRTQNGGRNATAKTQLMSQITSKIHHFNEFTTHARHALDEIPIGASAVIALISGYLGLRTLKEGPLVEYLSQERCIRWDPDENSNVVHLKPGVADFRMRVGRVGSGDVFACGSWCADVEGYMPLSRCRLTVDELWQWIEDRPSVPNCSLCEYVNTHAREMYEDIYDMPSIRRVAPNLCKSLLYKLRELAGWPVREHVLPIYLEYGRTISCADDRKDGPALVTYPERDGYVFKIIHDNSKDPNSPSYQPSQHKDGVIIGFLPSPVFWAWLDGENPTIPCRLETEYQLDDVTKQRYSDAGLPELSDLAPHMCQRAHGILRNLAET